MSDIRSSFAAMAAAVAAGAAAVASVPGGGLKPFSESLILGLSFVSDKSFALGLWPARLLFSLGRSLAAAVAAAAAGPSVIASPSPTPRPKMSPVAPPLACAARQKGVPAWAYLGQGAWVLHTQ